jgi:hypothetical protein
MRAKKRCVVVPATRFGMIAADARFSVPIAPGVSAGQCLKKEMQYIAAGPVALATPRPSLTSNPMESTHG